MTLPCIRLVSDQYKIFQQSFMAGPHTQLTLTGGL